MYRAPGKATDITEKILIYWAPNQILFISTLNFRPQVCILSVLQGNYRATEKAGEA